MRITSIAETILRRPIRFLLERWLLLESVDVVQIWRVLAIWKWKLIESLSLNDSLLKRNNYRTFVRNVNRIQMYLTIDDCVIPVDFIP